ncbi:hypothetical protein PVAND_010166 [Polypedilum vanderplanki]|uniref:Uncharacterized protein n=1 Tax=Polypedilum vanderplanki TaxID=319348 RepID=A0A9J6CFU1_POLVA|nr:hypothetical protein PVAND_010166 [Polypedilum vanderplanki]
MLERFLIVFVAIMVCIHPSYQRRQTFKCNDYVTETTSYHRSGISFRMGPHYICYLSNVIQVSSAIEIVDEIISHAFVDGNSAIIEPREVGAIVVKNSNFIVLPSQLFNKFRNLLVFRASDVNLRQISREDFRDTEHLTILHLDRNQIFDLEDGILMYLKRLQRLDLSRNMITAINEDTFSGCSSDLYEVDLSYNRITKLDYSTLIPLAHAKKLSVELNLNFNEIKEIHESHRVDHLTFEALQLKNNLLESFTCPDIKIGELHLENNRLQLLSFDNCSVEYLIVSQNHLNWLHIHGDLKGLVASHNKISSFVVSGADTEIYHFDLSENENINHVFPSLKEMNEMQFLNLSHSFIGVLEPETFTNMRELKYLFLKDCGIEIIPFEVFGNNKRMMTLDISDNLLETIDLHMFVGLDRLKILDISGNKLNKIDGFERVRSILPELSEIRIDGNRFECNDLRVILKTFEGLGINVIMPNYSSHSKSVSGIECY